MGIYDRDYYRREGPSFLESFTGQGRACKWLIGINVLFFLAQNMAPVIESALVLRPGVSRGAPLTDPQVFRLFPHEIQQLDEDPTLRPDQYDERLKALLDELRQREAPAGVLQGQVWRLLTYAFLHGGMMHILFNMLFLWWFGHEMEDLYGSRELILFYLVSAFLGGVVYMLWSVLRGSDVPCLGASGAVTAVLLLYAFHYPTRVIYFFFLPMPVWLFVGLQVVKDVLGFASRQPTGVAESVHLAGAAFGLCYYKFNWRLAPIWSVLTRFRVPKRRPRLSVYREEEVVTPRPPRPQAPSPAAVPAASDADEHLEAKVDAVLEKVGRVGIDKLTESERALLTRASEVYKRKQRP